MVSSKQIKAYLTVNGEKSPSFAYEEGASAVFDFESSRRLGVYGARVEVVSDADGKVKKYPCPWIKMKNGNREIAVLFCKISFYFSTSSTFIRLVVPD